jgi:hypothetical protein
MTSFPIDDASMKLLITGKGVTALSTVPNKTDK